MEVDLCRRTNDGEKGIGLQQQYQLRTLAQLVGYGPLPHQALRLLDNGCGEEGPIQG